MMKKFSAQGETGLLQQIIEAAVQQKPDLIITVTTPVLIAVAHKVSEIPVVFTVASDPGKLGIFTNGRPDNICGIYANPQMDKLLAMAVKSVNGLKAAGIIYNPSEINSMISVERLRAAGKEKRINILEAQVSSVTDMTAATLSLADRGAGALLLSADNLVYLGFQVINKTAKMRGIPVFVTDMELIDEGADGGIGVSFYEWGKQSGKLAAKVLAGAIPERLPCAENTNNVIVEPGSHK